MPFCRCVRCGARRTLNKAPENYLVMPRCPRASCANRTKRAGEKPRWRIDQWRHNHERRSAGKRAPKPCVDHWCDYAFPHRKGSRGCIHHPEFHTGEEP